jgi:putative AdoMet-dependent methyltransferase
MGKPPTGRERVGHLRGYPVTPLDEAREFDDWAPTYDETVARSAGYPFAGYPAVLETISEIVATAGARTALDLGVGTGNLSAALLRRSPTLEVWGVDFSEGMLRRAREKLPSASLLRADLRNLPGLKLPRFDAVVSSYALHELPDGEKLTLIEALLASRLTPGGLIAVGDIAFETRATLEEARRVEASRWDDSEYPWVAAEFLPRARTGDRRGVRAGVALRRCVHVPRPGWGAADRALRRGVNWNGGQIE